tara:strand:- start:10373 stop:10555 length:183 start_codon:yes stop_codon:yes gene_type:complete
MALSYEDRQLLRKVVLNVHMQYYPKHMLTDYEADKLIDSFIPETVEKMIKSAKDNKIDAI